MKKLKFKMSIDKTDVYDSIYEYTKEDEYLIFKTDDFKFEFYYDDKQFVFKKISDDNILTIDHINKKAELQVIDPNMDIELKLISSKYLYNSKNISYRYMLESTENIINIEISIIND